MTNSKISIIVPCYNQAQYLDECLQSVIEQTYQNWECIIVNDGSPDNTEEVAKRWLEKDSRFKYIYKENGGLSSARNAGIDLASGCWVQFLDSDDSIHNDKLKSSIEIINQNPQLKLVVSNFKMFVTNTDQVIDTSSKFNQESLTFENILFQWGDTFTIPIHCGFFNLKIIRQVKFDESFKAIEDWIMWLGYFRITEKAFFLNLPLAFYRNNQNSMTKNHELILDNLVMAYKHILKSLPSEYSERFVYLIFDRLNWKIKKQRLKVKTLETKNKNFMRLFFKRISLKIVPNSIIIWFEKI